MTWPDGRRGPPRPDDPRGGGRRAMAPDRGGPIALLLGIAGVIMSVLFFPVGLALDVAAIVVGVRTLRGRGAHPGRETSGLNGGKRSRAPGAVPGVVLGSVGALLAAIVITVLSFFWQEVQSYRECMSGANTIMAQEQCRTAFERSVERRLGLRTAP